MYIQILKKKKQDSQKYLTVLFNRTTTPNFQDTQTSSIKIMIMTIKTKMKLLAQNKISFQKVIFNSKI